MYQITDFSAYAGRAVISSHATFEEALRALRGMGIAHYERDEDHPGCADALMHSGRVLSIQPVKGSL